MFNDKYGLTQAVLEGRKTMTRRCITYPSRYRGVNVAGYFICKRFSGELVEVCMHDEDGRMIDGGQILPKYQVGEVIAIAQSYMDLGYDPNSLERDPKDLGICGFMKHSAGWKNKMFVRADACKKHVKITGIWVERMQDISDSDCLREGITLYGVCKDGINRYRSPYLGKYGYVSSANPKDCFAALIDKVSGKGTWENNPFVWVYEFELVD